MEFPPVDEQLVVICRGIEKIVPEEELERRIRLSREQQTPLRVKYGIDPTGIDVHLGHTVPLRKMRQFQELGHQAVIIIGNYTALVGDPSGRDESRARLTAEQIEENAVDYLNQVGKVIDLSKAEVVRNGDWFSEMSFADVLELFGKVTLRQLLTRDDFAKRFEDKDNPKATIWMHEMFYPVMQAWDSVKVEADIELGGTEQLYSFMLARHLQQSKDQRPQIGIMSPILVGLDGVKRMGKSLGNYIGISESPYAMMKKFMQLPDDCMKMYFELLTDRPLEEITSLLAGHPKTAKVALAKAIIGDYHSAGEADAAADRWQQEVGQGGKPADIPAAQISRSELTDGCLPAAVLLKLAGLVPSTSEGRRVINQGGAKLGEEKTRVESHDQQIVVEDGLLLWVGKKRFCRIELSE